MHTWLASVSQFLDRKHDPKTLPIPIAFSLFSAQISGFRADFHRKLLDIVQQQPNNAGIWADGMFWDSYQGPTLVNISLMVQFDKNREWGKCKTNRSFDFLKSS